MIGKPPHSERPRDPESARISLLGDGPLASFKSTLLKRMARSPLGWRVNFSVNGHVGSASLKIPLMLGRGYQNLNIGEAWLYRAFAKVLVSRPGAFIDVGVNLGQTLIKVKLIDPKRSYYGFEPNPQCAQYVAELINVNALTDCTLVPVGLSDAAHVVTLWAKADAVDPSASVVAGFRPAGRYTRRQDVPVFVGDDVLREVEAIALIKIDVEGGELEAVAGLTSTLRRTMPLVFCEILPVFSETTENGQFRKRRQEQLLAIFDALGYRVFRMLGDEKVVELGSIETHADLALTNYAFVPPAEQDSFRRLFRVPLASVGA